MLYAVQDGLTVQAWAAKDSARGSCSICLESLTLSGLLDLSKRVRNG